MILYYKWIDLQNLKTYFFIIIIFIFYIIRKIILQSKSIFVLFEQTIQN
ncbi:unnamed protein product [Paramecium sonneborni]|uniref:Uncharacterized protein n=1 Tax=Paramecium sonneborni TaxID=65129 RepID=A0A8S1JUY1_9CILI|nr:unnamed protein product [Paramecium sonneborni]